MLDRFQGLFKHLDAGNATEYVENRLFGNSIDTLENHIERKRALAEPTRYTILYLAYEYNEISRKRLSKEIGRTSNKLQQPLQKLLNAELLEEIPGPKGADKRRTYYRITTLGKQEIESDLRNITGEPVPETEESLLVDPDLSPGGDESESRLRYEVNIETEPANLKAIQEGLHNQYERHKLAARYGD